MPERIIEPYNHAVDDHQDINTEALGLSGEAYDCFDLCRRRYPLHLLKLASEDPAYGGVYVVGLRPGTGALICTRADIEGDWVHLYAEPFTHTQHIEDISVALMAYAPGERLPMVVRPAPKGGIDVRLDEIVWVSCHSRAEGGPYDPFEEVDVEG